MTGQVRAEVLGEGSRRVGRLTLDAPGTLNSLTLEMVETLNQHLDAWREDPSIACVFIDGEGEKAFCAGGDVQALRNSSVENPGGPCEYAEQFFAREYRMNYLLHIYEKPIVCWGHGVVMGGGLGIMAACSHRVASERTRIGMPEITIALFPDVGGSWFLNQMPGHVGRFLALTAVHINATDALFCQLADAFCAHSSRDEVLAALVASDWEGDSSEHHRWVSQVLNEQRGDVELPGPQVEPALETINGWMDGDSLSEIVDRVLAWKGDDAWLGKAQAGLAHGSKLAASWIFRQLNDTRGATLEQVFASELRLGTNILRYPEFAEGVRALLIDKDREPKWAYDTVSAIPSDVLASFFAEPSQGVALELPPRTQATGVAS